MAPVRRVVTATDSDGRSYFVPVMVSAEPLPPRESRLGQ